MLGKRSIGFKRMTYHLRSATSGDLAVLEAIALAMGTPPGRDDFPRCLAAQEAGDRMIFLAMGAGDAPLGYVQLNFTPVYQPFKRLGIAEVQDLNVVPLARNQGIGAALVTLCEDTVRTRGGSDIGISVGLVPSFGAAQRLYTARGYRPDGAGLCYDDVPVRVGSMVAADDLLTLKLVKTL